MTLVPPPPTCPGTPQIEVAAAGTVLYRLHSSSFAPTAFNPTKADNPLKGGRFDSHEGTYGYLYAASSYGIAIAETLVRSVPGEQLVLDTVPSRSAETRRIDTLLDR